MADPSLFGNYFSATTGMGNPLTDVKQPANPFDPRKENEMLPWVITNLQNRQNLEEDPARLREKFQIYKEMRLEEAQNAARLQAERDKRAFQYQMMAEIPRTITQTSANLAQMALNAPDLRIRAQIPDLVRTSWGAFPEISIPRGRGFS